APAPRRQHGSEDSKAPARLGAKPADPAGARIEIAPGAAFGRQRIMIAIVLADAVTQLAVAAGDAELLNPRMLVGRHGLAGQLATQPVEFLAHDDGAARAQCAQGCSNATKAAANDEDV